MAPHCCLPTLWLLAATLTISVLLPGVSPQATDVGIKLCGRDFVRTVIISCGGSRWKRYSPEENDERDNVYRILLDSLDDSSQNSPNEEPEVEEIDDTEPETQLGESDIFLPHFEGQRTPVGSNDDWDEEPGARLSSAFLVTLERKSSRSKRSASGLAKSCCKRGCTRSEIARLC
ncbi:relaxin-3-like [Rhincodon typus]|uniref:relaxin-3-like n=1 Tax=Rhincodon typus TaxID=259920 RepID=UPI0009A3E1F0|nr:relaxin-3-like [Rhincodon typus]